MAVKYGTVGYFNSDQENRVSYTELLTQYFIANNIAEEGDKRRAIYYSVSVVLLHTMQNIRNLVAPGKPTHKTFSEIATLAYNHHQSRPSTIVQ